MMPYNQLVRRILAIAIVCVLGLPVVSPLFALTGAANPNLPACCRRDGKHHCMGMSGTASAALLSGTQTSTATLSERCPFGSHSLPGVAHSGSTLCRSAAIISGALSQRSVSVQTESKHRSSANRSHQKRGPPASNALLIQI